MVDLWGSQFKVFAKFFTVFGTQWAASRHSIFCVFFGVFWGCRCRSRRYEIIQFLNRAKQTSWENVFLGSPSKKKSLFSISDSSSDVRVLKFCNSISIWSIEWVSRSTKKWKNSKKTETTDRNYKYLRIFEICLHFYWDCLQNRFAGRGPDAGAFRIRARFLVDPVR